VLVFVHGGGFQYDDKHRAGSPFYDDEMLWAVREGFVGVNLNYRTGPQNPWSASSEDLGLAIRQRPSATLSSVVSVAAAKEARPQL
jgi:acetyl esterase/lipase